MRRLVEVRRATGKTQECVAKYLGVARNTYTRYETGEREPDYETLKKIAEYFSTTTSYLIGEIDDPAPPGVEKEPPTLKDALRGEGIEDEEFERSLQYLINLKKRAGNNIEIAGEFLDYESSKRKNG